MSRETARIMTRQEEEEMEESIRQRRGQPPSQRVWRPSGSSLDSTGSGTSGPGMIQQKMEGKIINHSSRLLVGYADTIGRRQTMEDEFTIHGRMQGLQDRDYIAVFDGHGGRDASELAAQALHKHLEKLLAANEEPETSLKQAFSSTNEDMIQNAVQGGTTAIVALFIKNTIYIANAGDSRAVISKNGQAIRCSVDHKPDLPEEEARIQKSGGIVTKMTNRQGKTISRVQGMLAVSRALGDIFLHPFVSSEPDVTKFTLSSNANEILILACDGLWDVMDDDEATKIATSIEDPEQAAVKLRDTALEKGSQDNISVIVVRLPRLDPSHEKVLTSSPTSTIPIRTTRTAKVTTKVLVAAAIVIVVIVGLYQRFLEKGT